MSGESENNGGKNLMLSYTIKWFVGSGGVVNSDLKYYHLNNKYNKII